MGVVALPESSPSTEDLKQREYRGNEGDCGGGGDGGLEAEREEDRKGRDRASSVTAVFCVRSASEKKKAVRVRRTTSGTAVCVRRTAWAPPSHHLGSNREEEEEEEEERREREGERERSRESFRKKRKKTFLIFFIIFIYLKLLK